MTAHIKINKSAEWIRDYLRLAKHYVRLGRLDSVIFRKPHSSKILRSAGMNTKIGTRHRITIHTHDQRLSRIKPIKLILLKFSKIDLLRYLAHELSHIEHWGHTPAHQILTSEITEAFMDKLREDGYESEEVELKGQISKW